jgi:hypothetical protein
MAADDGAMGQLLTGARARTLHIAHIASKNAMSSEHGMGTGHARGCEAATDGRLKAAELAAISNSDWGEKMVRKVGDRWVCASHGSFVPAERNPTPPMTCFNCLSCLFSVHYAHVGPYALDPA